MLLYGTASPSISNTHTGVLLREQDLEEIVKSGSMQGIPVRIEHNSEPIGEVVSAWTHDNRLDCVMRLNSNSIEGMFGMEFVKSGRCPELSIGYTVSMCCSEDGMLSGGKKEIHEVSLVRSGAQHDCKIRAWKA